MVRKWWITQEPHIRRHCSRLGGWRTRDWRCLHLVNSATTSCSVYSEQDGFTLRGTFMDEEPVRPIYLLLFRPILRPHASGHLEVVFSPRSERYYWAFDKDGRDRLTQDMAESLGLPTPQFEDYAGGFLVDPRASHLLSCWLAAKGFDPRTRNAAIELGYPLLVCESMKRKRWPPITIRSEEVEPRMPGAWLP
ncbi:hypothetical protein FB45DRAFT_216992 [Roridomyces roridus]|uniref:Uncharacterized protein n=1 Tax=Roridomyces roridus TaxID=1738132 RepID=A0AAD7BDU7_9AGAR|nr:hypothetical protein FB45DRAFT_216992 [Roridomyces roridus]